MAPAGIVIETVWVLMYEEHRGCARSDLACPGML